jgi:hypothetical protein
MLTDLGCRIVNYVAKYSRYGGIVSTEASRAYIALTVRANMPAADVLKTNPHLHLPLAQSVLLDARRRIRKGDNDPQLARDIDEILDALNKELNS